MNGHQRYRHLELARLMPITARRGKGSGPRVPQRNATEHATRLDAEVDAVIAATADVGFDPRLLLKLEVQGLDPAMLENVEGFQVVSHQDNTVVALFATDAALREFKRRLGLVRAGQAVVRSEIIYAINRIELWSANDRRGHALSTEGLPDTPTVVVDVELWPLERMPDREALCSSFEQWMAENGIERLDAVKNRASLILYRVRLAT